MILFIAISPVMSGSNARRNSVVPLQNRNWLSLYRAQLNGRGFGLKLFDSARWLGDNACTINPAQSAAVLSYGRSDRAHGAPERDSTSPASFCEDVGSTAAF